MSMGVKSCKNCGKLFRSLGNPFCPECVKEMDDKFRVVRDYIYDNEHATVEDITEETGVSETMVLEFLREGRLSLATESPLLVCDRCGKPAKSGMLCESCREQQKRELTRARDSLNKTYGKSNDKVDFSDSISQRGRMHTNTGDKK